MLKRLELVGFKSFADKTQFDFPAGITAIVGPNGSGKSNIVDAVRWVLGEQSAKSLRGGEMADVIFNGSTSRRSLGLAEVTMTFDNRRRILVTDAEEVQITRRVYRDGEGEYLINQQLSRLKDIKELFLGSGAGTDAYCVIEQGRVDVLLQASTKDRRTIFEEAAGISRFKAKKTEASRKLERVDQNLQRLQDIVDEVEKQLRSVKLQAAKAQRFQEYSAHLKELRVALGLKEFHEFAERLRAETAVLDGLRAGLEEYANQAEAFEADTRRLETVLARLEEATHEQETLLAQARQWIATEETTLSHESSLAVDLETDLAQMRTRISELNVRVAVLAEAADRARNEVTGVETLCQEQRQGVAALEQELDATVGRMTELQTQIEADKADHLEQMQQAARLQNDAVSYKAHLDNLRRGRERLRLKTEQAVEHLASIDLELQALTEADEALQTRLNAARQHLSERRQERDRIQHLEEDMRRICAELRAERSGVTSRIEVLEGLERSREGLGTGAKEVLGILEQPDPGPWRTVLGIVADFIQVRHEYAPLIDLALGERAQRFLVRDMGLLREALQQRGQPLLSRVSFLPLTPATAENRPGHANRLIELSPLSRVRMPRSPEGLPTHPGMVALAEHLVSFENPELADLPAQLLGQTLIVRDLETARAVAAHTSGYRFVTLDGEVLEDDGTLTTGIHHAETGILSRKSELRELRDAAAALGQRIAEADRDLADLRSRAAVLNQELAGAQEELVVLTDQAADLRARIGQHQHRRAGLHEEVVLSRTEISGVEQEIEHLEQSWSEAQRLAHEAEHQVQVLQRKLEEAHREIRDREQQREQRQQACTAAKVALAQVEERFAALRAKYAQIEADLEQRRREWAQGEQHLTAARARLLESKQTMLRASSALARHYLEKEAAERQLAESSRQRDAQRQEKQISAEQAHQAREAWRNQQEQSHARELEVNDIRHRRDALVERLREDYQLDLAEVYQQALAVEQEHAERPLDEQTAANESAQRSTAAPAITHLADPDTVNEEIAELRRKLSRLGSVNLESLQELAELETRSATLKAQLDDLTAAKRSLEDIIAKINQDSRRLFVDAFATIRNHFQELFRKLFGGGMADIVLEDENDILETGIEIIARPPGKELRSISLMSGGEKTMTAVALLLAIFRSKPSPFCILDEVDAALDEANIGRFTEVLHEFLDRSHFIIITHSKRTMTVADVLYGITMQESGVSKRVAVRLEDWHENGHAPPHAPTVASVRNGQGTTLDAERSA
ncbi:MAG TPA: chromosome segregation protein SMC [Gemmataceae bacterium]|nr:chromosome segregation protein SMC [Gemmataceae bacterium]